MTTHNSFSFVPEGKPLNQKLVDFVVSIVSEYRVRKNILPTEQLDIFEIDEVVGGIRDVILMAENTYYKYPSSKKKPEEETEEEEEETQP